MCRLCMFTEFFLINARIYLLERPTITLQTVLLYRVCIVVEGSLSVLSYLVAKSSDTKVICFLLQRILRVARLRAAMLVKDIGVAMKKYRKNPQAAKECQEEKFARYVRSCLSVTCVIARNFLLVVFFSLLSKRERDMRHVHFI